MDRIYKHQFVIKKVSRASGGINDRESKRNHLLFSFYRNKLRKLHSEIPKQIALSFFDHDLRIDKDKPFNTLLVKEVERYNLLIEKIHENFRDTLAVLEGMRQADEATEDTFECL